LKGAAGIFKKCTAAAAAAAVAAAMAGRGRQSRGGEIGY
jgi:hypothetical protein